MLKVDQSEVTYSGRSAALTHRISARISFQFSYFKLALSTVSQKSNKAEDNDFPRLSHASENV